MKRYFNGRSAIPILLAIMILTACGPMASAPPIPTVTATVSSEGSTSKYQPLSAEECESLSATIGAEVGVPFEVQEAPFEDYINQTSGTGCLIAFQGMGTEINQSFVEVSRALTTLFQAEGWLEDSQYLADSPTVTATAFRREEQLCLVNVGWEPTAEVGTGLEALSNAPLDQQIWAITVNCAQPS